MPRPKRCRWVSGRPAATFFKPRGIPMAELETIALELDELEALRLADLEGRYHEKAAAAMGVSRQTFGRIIESARRKVADALLNGRALAIATEGAAVRPRPCRRAGLGLTNRNERYKQMKVAVTAEADGLDARPDPRFGRCAKFVVVDPATMENESVANDAAAADSGAGIGAAQTLVRMGAGAVLTGHCGPKAFAVLNQAGIQVYQVSAETVGKAIEQFKSGSLRPLAGPSAASHSGMRG